ncbi:hypothetical protein [Janthinobacterium fluminis]|uniref:Transposase n=1 Tax=Janthinobacterium fluminis TaxID=2987524 RepID=A0ABT5JUP6_9BURK|nr:hypothetical protein [Janthinobacterium fluminis]MDC8756466.1 hypothetical protein [Janthinobacterium fluminis]
MFLEIRLNVASIKAKNIAAEKAIWVKSRLLPQKWLDRNGSKTEKITVANNAMKYFLFMKYGSIKMNITRL